MKKKDQRNAERVVLSQDYQIQQLSSGLDSLERQRRSVSSANADQSASLTDLDTAMEQLYTLAGLARPGEAELADSDILKSLQLTSAERQLVDAGLPNLSLTLEIPHAEGDWDAYLADIDRHLGKHALALEGDPFEQLVRPQQMAAVYRRFDEDFGAQPWDRWDYGAVGLTVLVGALLDYFLVAIPQTMKTMNQDTVLFKGEAYRGSPVTAWMRQQSENISSGEGSAFQRWLGDQAKAAERYAKVSYDISNNRQINGEIAGLRPAMHRLMNPGHDPVLGVVFGVIDILRGNCTLIDRFGAWNVITPEIRTGDVTGVSNPVEALMMVFAHLFSDVFTSTGLPAPFMTAMQSFNVNTGISVEAHGAPLQMPDLIRHMYGQGYDLQHFMTMSIVPMTAEAMIRTYHWARTYDPETPHGVAGIRDKMKLGKMITATHALLSASNIIKMGLYGWNPSAFNWAQILMLSKQLFTLLMAAHERDQLVEQQLVEGWEQVLQGARRL